MPKDGQGFIKVKVWGVGGANLQHPDLIFFLG
jgi:hypothetical protein